MLIIDNFLSLSPFAEERAELDAAFIGEYTAHDCGVMIQLQIAKQVNNAAAGRIAGTFNNLPDGSTLIVGSNTYKANYEGGTGNDLTLTVQ